MADKDGMERKVYLLPSELVERIKSYQAAQGISSEVEAARRLLDSALQMRDTVEDILIKLDARFAEEKDLRVLARDILATHPLVTEIKIDDVEVGFKLRNDQGGSLLSSGQTMIIPSGEDYPREWIPPSKRQPVNSKSSTKAGWDSGPGKGGNLDDEIPF